jgi:hypothetical protein
VALELRRGGNSGGVACTLLCVPGEHAYASDILPSTCLAKQVFYAWSSLLFQSKARNFDAELEAIRGSKKVSSLFDVDADKLAVTVSFTAWARLVHLAQVRLFESGATFERRTDE